MERKPIGKITHVFPKISVAVVELDGELKAGDTISIEGPGGKVVQTAASMQIDRKPVSVATAGQSIGLKVDGVVHEKDLVFKEQ